MHQWWVAVYDGLARLCFIASESNRDGPRTPSVKMWSFRVVVRRARQHRCQEKYVHAYYTVCLCGRTGSKQ
jgi:hypothetical protein